MENKIKADIDRPSNQILNDMSSLKDEFEKTKSLLVTLTHHLDSLENAYNKLNKEIKKRNGA
tara:strand:+ start:351 stop:536 length:186 start_codon:yes stop_codon:yes gene_type:complete